MAEDIERFAIVRGYVFCGMRWRSQLLITNQSQGLVVVFVQTETIIQAIHRHAELIVFVNIKNNIYKEYDRTVTNNEQQADVKYNSSSQEDSKNVTVSEYVPWLW